MSSIAGPFSSSLRTGAFVAEAAAVASASFPKLIQQTSEKFARVTRAWKDETVVCFGGGPSLTAEQIELVRRANVPSVAINDAYLVAPFADICYFADWQWWKWHTDGIAKAWPWAKFTKDEQRAAFAGFRGQKLSIEDSADKIEDPDVLFVRNARNLQIKDGLSDRDDALVTGKNGGYQALGIAYLSGAKRIILLGYDMRFEEGRSHAHDGHPRKQSADTYARYAQQFQMAILQVNRAGIDVVNCSPKSALNWFRKSDLEDALG